MSNLYPEKMNERVKGLYQSLINRALTDRSREWFTRDMLEDLSKFANEKSIISRRAMAIDVMLKAMTNIENSQTTCTAEIQEGDLLLGTLPMGSNGLGKVFPNYLAEEELRIGSITNRSSMSLIGHNTLDYSDLVNKGLDDVIKECDRHQNEDESCCIDIHDSLLDDHQRFKHQQDFYEGVKISCRAVIDYANRFADIADTKAKHTTDPARKAELLHMAETARKVPKQKADTFYEAVQSIWFYHVALHASMNFISFGRLDQVLQPFYEKGLLNGKGKEIQEKNREYQARCLEIFECFIIKAAWRLNLDLSPENIVKQDHVDYTTVLGTNPYLIDQKAGVNNFLQNIIVAGKTPEGEDATNDCTYLILQAFENVNLSTPGIYVRIHKNSPDKLKRKVAASWIRTRNNPAILNDEVIITAMRAALMQGVKSSEAEKIKEKERLANDYCVDGCWEPILNGKSDWTFSMLSALTPFECALNQGALLTNDPEVLRGSKKAPETPVPRDFQHLMEIFEKQMQFFVDQGVIAMFIYYMMDAYAAPSPLLSTYLAGCMKRGRDKAWGGTDYNIGGVIISGIPNAVNTLAAMKKWVFPDKGKGKYTLAEVVFALKSNFTSADPVRQEKFSSIQIDFSTNTPKFGNNDDFTDDIAKQVLDHFYDAVKKSKKLCKEVFEDKPAPDQEAKIISWRSIAGYYGLSLEEKFGKFDMKITAGMGTFEQYNWMGRGNAASADRLKGQPLAPNFSPVPGTDRQGIGGVLASFKKFGLERFAAGVITDFCLDENYADEDVLMAVINQFIANGGNMMTLTVGSSDVYADIMETTIASQKMKDRKKAIEMLAQYSNVNVRIGGWQTPFITLPLSHMENYVQRPVLPDMD
ncbi:MAG: formate acetyltransferase [bacterium]|nr:formate acetyltransferase [bacterium]